MKMTIRFQPQTIEKWRLSLARAGDQEIGGVLFAEQIGEGNFRIVETTQQRFGGDRSSFIRRGGKARRDINSFHRTYGRKARRFNYIGEWHSHPNAAAHPSPQDEITMRQLLVEQSDAVNFLVLAIAKLDAAGNLEIGAVTFLSSGHKILCDCILEEHDGDYDKPQRKIFHIVQTLWRGARRPAGRGR